MECIDIIRGIAVLSVFIFHAYEITLRRDSTLPPVLAKAFFPLTYGWGGVAMFFVVSGFCIHLSYARQPDWFAFSVKRFCRIYPPYLLALLFFGLLFPLTRLSEATLFNSLQLSSHVLLVHNLNERSMYGINPAFWSLAVEVQLYMVYPLLLALVSRCGWVWSLVITLLLEVAIVEGKALFSFPAWVSGTPFAYWCSWSIGAAVAEAHLQGRRIQTPRYLVWLLLAALVVGIWSRSLAAIGFLVFALLTGIMLTRLLNAKPQPFSGRGILARHLKQVGLWSYSVYLLHQPLIWLVEKVGRLALDNPKSGVAFLLCMGSWFVIVPIAGMFYMLSERPSHLLGRFLLANLKTKCCLPKSA